MTKVSLGIQNLIGMIEYDFPYNADNTLPLPMMKTLHQAGIDVDSSIFENIDSIKGKFMKKYEGRPGFEERFYTLQ